MKILVKTLLEGKEKELYVVRCSHLNVLAKLATSSLRVKESRLQEIMII